MYKGKKRIRTGKRHVILKKRWMFSIGMILFLFFGFLAYLRLKPYVLAYARMNADSLMSTIANEALREGLSEYGVTAEDLVHYYYDDEGDIIACGVDTLEIGRLSVEILAAMDGYFEEHDAVEFQVPMGAALGENIFIGWWPDIPFRVRLIGNADINYDSTVEAAGINQVHHKVWLDLKFTIQVAAPLMSEILTSSRQFVLVDRTFAGDVPLVFME